MGPEPQDLSSHSGGKERPTHRTETGLSWPRPPLPRVPAAALIPTQDKSRSGRSLGPWRSAPSTHSEKHDGNEPPPERYVQRLSFYILKSISSSKANSLVYSFQLFKHEIQKNTHSNPNLTPLLILTLRWVCEVYA